MLKYNSAIYNNLGIKVKEFDIDDFNGNYKCALNIGDIKHGVYYCIITFNEKSILFIEIQVPLSHCEE